MPRPMGPSVTSEPGIYSSKRRFGRSRHRESGLFGDADESVFGLGASTIEKVLSIKQKWDELETRRKALPANVAAQALAAANSAFGGSIPRRVEEAVSGKDTSDDKIRKIEDQLKRYEIYLAGLERAAGQVRVETREVTREVTKTVEVPTIPKAVYVVGGLAAVGVLAYMLLKK